MIKEYMLVCRRVDNLKVGGYTYLDLGGCLDDRRSTSIYIFMMAEGEISWKNKCSHSHTAAKNLISKCTESQVI